MDISELKYISSELIVTVAATLALLSGVFSGKYILAKIISLVGIFIAFVFAIGLWFEPSTYAFYNTINANQFSIFFKLLILGTLFLVILGSYDYIEYFGKLKTEYLSLMMYSSVGMMLLPACNDFITAYISLELISLPLVAIIAMTKEEFSIEASLKFFIISAVSSAFLLYGIVLLYGFSGSTNFDIISHILSGTSLQSNVSIVIFSFFFILGGVGFKVGLVPFHMWVPDVYQGGPTPIVTFLSIASKSAGFALLIKIFLLIFEYTDWTYIIAVIAVITMTVGNAGALLQDNSKRLLGYSGIAHAGYILIGIACFSTVNNIDGQVAVIFYLFTYSFANLAAFYSLMSLSQSTNSYSIQSYAGSFFHNKISSIVLMLALISLIGLPPTSGFIGKLYLFNMAIKSELILLVLFGVLNSVLSSFYYLKVIRILFQSNSNIAPNSSNSSVLLNSVLISTGLAILIIGIYPDPVLQLVETVVSS
jgi:NADH-quinone oxidoreductase subunit N